jgi:uncharacterized SAM-binding protein YcdF (DUF218 family)
VHARRIILITGLTVLALLLAWIVTMSVVLWMPHEDRPQHADVIIVLGPPETWRVQRALEFAQAGVSSNVLISVPSSWQPDACTHPPTGIHVACKYVLPNTTQGEARWLKAEMAANGWHTALAITMTMHATRANMILHRCVPTGVSMYAENHLTLGPELYQYLYQTAGFVKAFTVTRGC